MNIRKFLHGGAAVLAVLYAMSAMPAHADLCFLGTGECGEEDGINGAKNKTVACEEYRKAGNYYTSEQAGKSCERVKVSIDNCVLYSCTDIDCRSKGFVLGPTSDNASYPANRAASDWNCSSCKQGSAYWWTCTGKSCDGGTVSLSSCNTTTHDFVKVSKSGFEDCGFCNAKQVASINTGMTGTVAGSRGDGGMVAGTRGGGDIVAGSGNHLNTPTGQYTSSGAPRYSATAPDTGSVASTINIPNGFCSGGSIQIKNNTVVCNQN